MPQIKPPQNLGLLLSFALLLNRISLGLYLLFAGIQKFQLGLSVFFTEKYTPLIPEWLPSYLSKPFGYAIPFTEILLGVLLAVGLFSRITAILTTLTLIAILVALTQSLGFTALPEAASAPFNQAFVFATLAFLILILGPGPISIDHILRKRKAKTVFSINADGEDEEDYE